MSLVPLNVRRSRQQLCKGKNYSTTQIWAVDDSVIKLAVPSPCKTEGTGGNDGYVNSLVTISIDGATTYLWVTDTVATIYGLS